MHQAGGPMFGLGPQQAGDASHLDLQAVPASHCVGRRPLGKWRGTSIIIIHIIWQEVAAAAEAAVGYSWPEAREGICPYV